MYTEESCRLACVGGVRGCRAGGGSWLLSGSDSAALLLPPLAVQSRSGEVQMAGGFPFMFLGWNHNLQLSEQNRQPITDSHFISCFV